MTPLEKANPFISELLDYVKTMRRPRRTRCIFLIWRIEKCLPEFELAELLSPEPSKPATTDKARELLGMVLGCVQIDSIRKQIICSELAVQKIQSALTQAREEAAREAADRWCKACLYQDDCEAFGRRKDKCLDRAAILGKEAQKK